VGTAVLTGAAGATVAVGSLVAIVLPAGFVPVTRTRILEPTSAGVSVYVDALPAEEHASPAESQRSHWRAKLTVGVPVQLPSVALSVCPSRAVPLTTGGALLAGGAAATTALGALLTVAVPPPLRAVTSTRSVLPTSPAPSAYVAAVAFATAAHAFPAESQRSHRRDSSIVGVPLQPPVVELSVCPSRAVPETVGAVVLAGGSGATATVGSLVAVLVPPPFVPRTSTRIVLPTSPGTSA
jgi:hypothetical protein